MHAYEKQDNGGVIVCYEQAGERKQLAADILIGADVIHSAMRTIIRSAANPLGWMCYVAQHHWQNLSQAFFCGPWHTLRFVVYPISAADLIQALP